MRKTTLSFKKILGYAVGEFGFTFFLIYLAYYLMYYLTDVLMFAPARAAVIFTLCQWFEVFAVLVSGILINRSTRPYRQWMISGALICAVSMSLLFTKLSLPASLYSVIFSVIYLLVYWGYTMMWISYRSLLGCIGKIPYDAVSLSTTGFQLGTVASLLFANLGIRILLKYAERPIVYSLNAVGYGIIMVVCILIVFITSKPYDKERSGTAGIGIKEDIKNLFFVFKGPTIPLFVSIALRSAVPVAVSALMIYYLKIVIKDVSLMSSYILIMSVTAFAGAFASKIAVKYIDKRVLYISTGILNCLMLASLAFWGNLKNGFLIIMAVNGFFMFVGTVLVPSFFNDVSIFIKFRYEKDIRAITFSFGQLAIHASQIIGSGIASFGLVLIGYKNNMAVSSSTADGIQFLMSFIPAVLVLFGVIIFLFYKLDDKMIAEMHDDIK